MFRVTKLDRIRNERIRRTTKIGEISKKGVEVLWICDAKIGALCRMEGEGNGCIREEE